MVFKTKIQFSQHWKSEYHHNTSMGKIVFYVFLFSKSITPGRSTWVCSACRGEVLTGEWEYMTVYKHLTCRRGQEHLDQWQAQRAGGKEKYIKNNNVSSFLTTKGLVFCCCCFTSLTTAGRGRSEGIRGQGPVVWPPARSPPCCSWWLRTDRYGRVNMGWWEVFCGFIMFARDGNVTSNRLPW